MDSSASSLGTHGPPAATGKPSWSPEASPHSVAPAKCSLTGQSAAAARASGLGGGPQGHRPGCFSGPPDTTTSGASFAQRSRLQQPWKPQCSPAGQAPPPSAGSGEAGRGGMVPSGKGGGRGGPVQGVGVTLRTWPRAAGRKPREDGCATRSGASRPGGALLRPAASTTTLAAGPGPGCTWTGRLHRRGTLPRPQASRARGVLPPGPCSLAPGTGRAGAGRGSQRRELTAASGPEVKVRAGQGGGGSARGGIPGSVPQGGRGSLPHRRPEPAVNTSRERAGRAPSGTPARRAPARPRGRRAR